jgi:natural product biosynthesis luciferase-like monooxygenase protein
LQAQTSGRRANTFTELLASRAAAHGERLAYVFLPNGEDEEVTITFGQLHRRALALSGQLAASLSPGDRAVLLYPTGFEFIVAFFGCMYAGVIPVPASMPNHRRGIDMVRGIALDSGARSLMSTSALLTKHAEVLATDPVLQALRQIDTEHLDSVPASRAPVTRSARDVALLQYTSGSTGSPRGVIVTHGNLIENHHQLELNFKHDSSTVVVSWLPLFHDMGLGSVLNTLWTGSLCVVMPPSAFIQKPARWLRAISKYRAASSGGPNFGYDLCAQRIGAEEKQGLDLSSWTVAHNGSEPVRASTLQRFAEAFEPYGFRRKSFHPVYGLAECTLFVTGPKRDESAAVVRRFSREALAQGEAQANGSATGQPLVGCGHTWGDCRVIIVDTTTREELPSNRIGEIWVSGGSVAAGYWKRDIETFETFSAHTSSGAGPFLRTGDLGFVHDGEIFITGRCKDLIIIRGLNHYPQDIEQTVSTCHPSLEPHKCAAFSIVQEDGEQLVVVQEVKRTALRGLRVEEVERAIRSSVSQQHGLDTHAIVLLRPSGLLVTTSGKVRRRALQEAFLKGQLAQVNPSSPELEVPVTSGVAPSREVPGVKELAQRSLESAAAPATLIAEQPSDCSTADDLIAWLRSCSDGLNDVSPRGQGRELSSSILRDLAKRGVLGMQIERRYGGLGLGHRDTARVIEQLAALDLNAGLFVGLNHYLGIGPIARHATVSLKDQLLPRLAKGQTLAGFAFAEPGSSGSEDSLRSYAEAVNGSGWRLHGEKYVSGGGENGPGVVNVFVRHRDRRGVTAFLVPRDQPKGATSVSVGDGLGAQGLARTHVSLNGIEVSHDHILGVPGDGMSIALDAIGHARLAIAAACLGGMKRCAQQVFHYSTRTQTSGQRFASHPVTLYKLGRVTASVTALDCLVQLVTQAVDSGAHVPSEAFAVCKAVGPEMLWQAVDDLVQLLGRRGYVETADIAALVRDAQALRSCEGPTEVVSAMLGERLMTDPSAITALVRDVFKAEKVLPLIEQALDALQSPSPPAGEADAEAPAWLNTRAGELVTWVVLLAAVEGSRPRQAGAELERAAIWARANFDRVISLARVEKPSGSSETRPAIASMVATYANSVGELEPSILGKPRAVARASASAGFAAARIPSEPKAATSSQLSERKTTAVPAVARPVNDDSVPGAAALREWLIVRVAESTGIPLESIDCTRPLAELGLDSLRAVSIAGAAESLIKRTVPAVALWDHPTIDALAEYLSQLARKAPEDAAERSAVVSAQAPERSTGAVQSEGIGAAADTGLRFSLMYFSSNAAVSGDDKYRLVIEGTTLAEQLGLEAVWLPERHFHAFGGLYPEPSVLASALAMVTKRIRLRAGSVVLPLNDSVRVAERWAMVDNLSNGRVDLSFATGWNPNDFVLGPENFADRVQTTLRDIDTVRRLWRGESVERRNGLGQPASVRIYPTPRQPELNSWLTCTSGRERFAQAGALGLNVLTALLFQSVDALAENIKAYREARAANGHDPLTGTVTTMVHTFLGEDPAAVRETVAGPFKEYLRSSVDLWRQGSSRLEELEPREQERVLDYAFERYHRTSALLGTPESCMALALGLAKAGVNELACLVDFGVEPAATLNGLHGIARLKAMTQPATSVLPGFGHARRDAQPAAAGLALAARGENEAVSESTRSSLDDELDRLERELKASRERR